MGFSGASGVSLPVSIADGGTGQITAAAALAALGGAPLPALELQAATPESGYALINGTGTVISWTAPNDGNMHRFQIVGALIVTSAETGGEVEILFTPPGGTQQSKVFASPNVAPGTYNTTIQAGTIGPGTTVLLSQATALTAGAASVTGEIWGS